MLQFSEDFFQHEIREGFYVDSTMKTVWAAALDVLQTVAEVCERYGLEWYAAYGTLLGAIRHEGYIPWDDDLDIWMKRKDYQKLLEVLPGELPEEYHVLSPQTEEGYEQYHACIVCGEGISIEPRYLERHYGCPFRVGVDIFPLDYLPRDQRLCSQWKSIFLLARRIVQTVQEYRRLPADCTDQRKKGMKEIRNGIRYLKEYCGGTVDMHLLREERWDEVISAVYRIANDVIRRCPEQDADYLVMFRDYTDTERKVFPKEWFDKTWSAAFETVMLPIPWKYDELLHLIYGDYQVRYRNSASHDYPYYEKQLERLREMVRQRVQSADSEAEGILPAEWNRLFQQKSGVRKKAVLYTNDISDFIGYGEAALDKLESVLQTFYEARDQILLWWRPQQEMVSALTLADQMADRPDIQSEGGQSDKSAHQSENSQADKSVHRPEDSQADKSVHRPEDSQADGSDDQSENSQADKPAHRPENSQADNRPADQEAVKQDCLSAKGSAHNSLAERYSDILRRYKLSAWGICDESNDKRHALELCDAYYGVRNNMVEQFQDMGKPVMIALAK